MPETFGLFEIIVLVLIVVIESTFLIVFVAILLEMAHKEHKKEVTYITNNKERKDG